MVTHSLNLVQTMCDNAAWLDHGKLRALGPAPEVVHQYLDQVNVVEAERMEGVGQDVVEERALHDLITIERVEFLDREGRPTRTATPKEPLTVRLHWTAHEPIETPLLSFAVESEAGVYVSNPGMRTSSGKLPVGRGYTDYRIDELGLGPGQYTFSVAAHDHTGTTVLDKRERFLTLRVQPGTQVVYGLVDMLGSWQPPVGTTGES